ncbi:MAG: penicillin-insensitive murein endopeptidase [Myxococcales bacterium]|nr:penicillin-insensitive murein endopeptidase [Myxococcales bacterium]
MRRLRFLVLLAPILVGAGIDATAHGSPDEAITVLVPAMSVVAQPDALDPESTLAATIDDLDPERDDPMASPLSARPERDRGELRGGELRGGELRWDEVHWTVAQAESLDALASRWGLKASTLVSLNPELRGQSSVQPGTELRVYRSDEERPTRSIGSPNKGRLEHGLPMPEGPYWMLRDRRTRAFGATNAIDAMVTAFTRYGESYEDAPKVSVGEISARRGGRAAPHKSHRTGRDVDLGYILTTELPEGSHWKRADESNFDAEKNWALIKALVDTGQVQSIFISTRLQRLLRPVARRELDEAELARYFRVPDGDPEQAPIISHEDGHRDHMHVRFRCESGNARCRSRGH